MVYLKEGTLTNGDRVMHSTDVLYQIKRGTSLRCASLPPGKKNERRYRVSLEEVLRELRRNIRSLFSRRFV